MALEGTGSTLMLPLNPVSTGDVGTQHVRIQSSESFLIVESETESSISLNKLAPRSMDSSRQKDSSGINLKVTRLRKHLRTKLAADLSAAMVFDFSSGLPRTLTYTSA